MLNFTDYKTPIQEGIRLPHFKPSFSDLESVGLKEGADNYELLRKLCFQGVQRLGIDKLPNYDKYIERAKHELKTLKELCLVDYMLIVWDFINFARKNDIPLGNGRGSAAGSLVCYLTGITQKVDPIKYSLYFERFLSVDRVQPYQKDGHTFLKDCADIDVDISFYRRPEVIKYINEKYVGQTAQISTLSTLSGKACIKECMKIAGSSSEEEAQKVADLVEKMFGVVNPLKQVYEETPAFKEWADSNSRVFKIARKIENLNKNYGVHASGIAVAPENRENVFPCHKSKEGETVTSWEMGAIGDMAVKIDCLGLRTLDLLAVAEKESGVKMSDIDPEDRSIYAQFEELNHKYGLFQIETDAGFRITKQIKPNQFSQLSDIVAINRPGAIAFLGDYLAYKNGEKEIPKVHPIIDEILKDTGGVLLMQEQTMRILHEVYGFTLVEANQLRKVIGKKLRSEVGAWEEKIRARGKEKRIAESITDWYWGAIKASADYQFNACLCPLTTLINKAGEDEKVSLKDIKIGDKIRAFDTLNEKDHYVSVTNIYKQVSAFVRIMVMSAYETRTIKCSLEHKFLSICGGTYVMQPIAKILANNGLVILNGHVAYPKFIGVEEYGESIDLEVDHPDHNFYANNIVVSNSHSKSYSFLTMYCAWYKANKPKEFFLGALKLALSESKPQDIISEISQELHRFNIKLLPPDLAISDMDFSIVGNDIRYGLSAIKGVSEKTLESLKRFRNSEKPNKYDIFLSAKQAGLNIGILSALIQAGTLDNFGDKRVDLVLDAQVFNVLTDKEKLEFIKLGPKYDWSVVKTIKACMDEALLGENGKRIMTEKRVATLRKKCAKFFEIKKLNASHEKFANWYFEKTLLGYAYSTKLKECFERGMKGSADLKEMSDWQRGVFVGSVVEVNKSISKKSNNPYLKLTLSDEEGTYAVMLMDNKRAKKFTEFVESGAKLPEEGDIVICMGSKSNDIIFLDGLKIVNEKIYMKMSELKDSGDSEAK